MLSYKNDGRLRPQWYRLERLEGSSATGILACALCLLMVPPLSSSPQCDHYGGCRQSYPYLPAPPGKTPPCAKPGVTFCEKIEHYPTQLVRFLVERWGYDYNTLLSDESRDDFNYRTPLPVYGPHNHHPGYSYGPAKVAVPLSYYPVLVNGPANTSNHVGGGYPDRRYKLPQQYLTSPVLYTAVLQPGVSQYSPEEWWARYARANEESSAVAPGRHRRQLANQRPRRQSGTNENTLCPTTTRFIMPRAAMNNKGNWMYVVNLNQVDDRYTQLVGTETCTSNQCNGLCSIPNGYTSRCEQQYVQKRLVALESGGNNLYTDVFWFPHCCVCQITQN